MYIYVFIIMCAYLLKVEVFQSVKDKFVVNKVFFGVVVFFD